MSYIWRIYFPDTNKVNNFYRVPTKLPKFADQNDYYLNFYYCGLPKKLQAVMWDVTLFTNALTTWTRVILLVEFVLVTVVLFKQVGNQETGDILDNVNAVIIHVAWQ